MKKLIFAIMLITALSLTLFGCTSEPIQTTMSPGWGAYEKFTYAVSVKDSDVTGEYVSEVSTFKNRDVTIGSYEYPSVSASLLNNKLTIDGTVITESVLFNAPVLNENLAPYASVREETKNGVVTVTNIKYDNDNATAYYRHYSYNVGETPVLPEEQSIALPAKKNVPSPYYDNAMLYALLRSSLSSALTFNVPNCKEGTIVALQASGVAVTNVNCAFAENISAQPVNVFLTGTLTGNPHTAYYATDAFTVEGKAVKNAPVLIVEGDVTYSLKQIDVNP